MERDIPNQLSFLDDNPRFKALFLLLLRTDGYIKSEALATDLGVSARTIKSDLKQLKYELQRNLDISIISKQSKGYKLMVDSIELVNSLKEHFQIYQTTTIDNEFTTRVHYIIRILLISGEPIRGETLQEALCMNMNKSLTRELIQVKRFLANYNLTLVVQPHHGMTAKGRTFEKILCLVRMYKYFNKKSTPEFRIEAYGQLFQCPDTVRDKVRRVFLYTISNSRIVFSDIYAERFIVYLIYFRNQLLNEIEINLELPDIDFDETGTEEYELVTELIQKLRNQLDGFCFSDEVIRFLTYIAVMSTDLYRFRDCTKENYGTLIEHVEEMRNFMISRFSEYLQINMFDDYTCIKDLLKLMLPVSLKVLLGISDDVDLGYHNDKSMEAEPVLKLYLEKLSREFLTRYHYAFSNREVYMIFQVFYGMIKRIVLSHKKLNLAIIAIDGRLSTQQLKFNLQNNFSEFIEKIETRVLYELEFMENINYDYYLCMDYGKNMNIPYRPIHFADEEMVESEYVKALNRVFFDSYCYDEVLPTITMLKIEEQYCFDIFPVEKYLMPKIYYEKISLGNKKEIQIYFNFKSLKESVKIFYFDKPEGMTIHCEKYFVIIDLFIDKNQQKLKMILNVLEHLVENPDILLTANNNGINSYKCFFSPVNSIKY